MPLNDMVWAMQAHHSIWDHTRSAYWAQNILDTSDASSYEIFQSLSTLIECSQFSLALRYLTAMENQLYAKHLECLYCLLKARINNARKEDRSIWTDSVFEPPNEHQHVVANMNSKHVFQSSYLRKVRELRYLMLGGDLNEGIELLTRVIASYRTSYILWFQLGSCYYGRNRYQEASNSYAMANEVGPVNAYMIGGQCKALIALKEFELAEQVIKRALIAYPEDQFVASLYLRVKRRQRGLLRSLFMSDDNVRLAYDAHKAVHQLLRDIAK